MHAHDAWGGGSFDASMDSATDDDRSTNMDLDRASLAKLRESQQSWLLGPSDQKKQYVDLGCVNASSCCRKLLKYITSTVLASILLTGFIVMMVKLIPHHHPPPHRYTQAFHKALLFFNAQKSGNNISWRASSAIHDGEPPISEDSYTQALHKALLFFNAQKSGVLTKSNNISWRASSAIQDGEPIADLAGGYYDGGDNIKFGFPGAFTITMLSWSVIEYNAKYEAIGELSHVKELIKWGTDYILKTFNKTSNSINQVYAQVGVGSSDANNDDNCWERPEDMDYERPVATCGRCSDLAAETAAALAAASIVFKDERQYAQELLHGAEVTYRFARGPRGRYSMQVEDASRFYSSTSYWDEYVWSSAWLYYATGNTSYLSLATNPVLARHANAGVDGSLDFSWDNKLPGAQVILTKLRIMMNPGFPYEDILSVYNNLTNVMMCSYLPQFKVFNVTKGGLVQLNRGRPAPLQYNAAAAFLSALYADYLTSANIPGWNCGPNFLQSSALRNFSRSQIDYILGNNPNKMSYVVGYGKHYPTHVHHRGASIPSNIGSRGCTTANKYRDTKSPNPHVLMGAMVGGPDAHDRFVDVRTNYNFTKPTIAGNALLVAALISLSGGDTGTIDSNTIFSAIPPLFPKAPPPPAPWPP